jgi:hypothetical protein
VSPAFLRENYQQLSFTNEELAHRKTGILAGQFPASWQQDAALRGVAADADLSRHLSTALQGAPLLLLLLYADRQRAPGSEGDVLGFIGLGCVLENTWLAAECLGLAFTWSVPWEPTICRHLCATCWACQGTRLLPWDAVLVVLWSPPAARSGCAATRATLSIIIDTASLRLGCRRAATSLISSPARMHRRAQLHVRRRKTSGSRENLEGTMWTPRVNNVS